MGQQAEAAWPPKTHTGPHGGAPIATVEILRDSKSDEGKPLAQQVKAAGPPHLRVEAHGTAPIATLEVLRYSKSAGGFKVIYRIHPGALDFVWEKSDKEFREDSIYYVRLRQEGFVRRRIAMAWSSPIWVKRTGVE